MLTKTVQGSATCGQIGEVLSLVLVPGVCREADLLLQVKPAGGVQVVPRALKRLVQVLVVGPRPLQVAHQRPVTSPTVAFSVQSLACVNVLASPGQ